MTAPSAARTALVTVASVVAALLICALIFVFAGQSPAAVYGTMLRGTLGDPTGLAEVGRRTIPLLLLGRGWRWRSARSSSTSARRASCCSAQCSRPARRCSCPFRARC